jgi:uncharacterized Zn-binding protein involved in type VI secretion
MKPIYIFLSAFLLNFIFVCFGQPAARLGDMTDHGGSIVLGFPMVLIGGEPAARIGDMTTCPMMTPGFPPIPHVGGPIVLGCPMVLVGGMPQARIGDMARCVGPSSTIALGCPMVLVGQGGSTTLDNEEILLKYLTEINKDNPGLRITAAYLLGERKSLRAINPLMDILENDLSVEMRILAAISLYKIGDENGLQTIKRVKENDTNEKVKQMCEELYEIYESERKEIE